MAANTNGIIKEVFAGAFSYFKALRIIHQRNLWSYFLLPGAICIGLFILMIGIIALTFRPVSNWVGRLWPWEWGQSFIDETGGVLFALLLLALSVVLLRYIIIIAMGPFLSPLSEKVEFHINRKRYNITGLSTNLRLTWRGLRMALALIFYELLFTLPLYVLLLIPGVNVVVFPIIFLIQSYYAGLGNMDFVLERRFNVPKSLRKGREYKWLALGNGIIYMLMITSFIGIFFAPILSVAGLTVELVKRLDAEEELEGV